MEPSHLLIKSSKGEDEVFFNDTSEEELPEEIKPTAKGKQATGLGASS